MAIAVIDQAHVTPKDAIEVNQLASLSTGLAWQPSNKCFKVGQRCMFWLNISAYSDSIDIGNEYPPDFWCTTTITVNELATQIVNHARSWACQKVN